MKRTSKFLIIFAILFLININTFAQKDACEDILIVIPTQSILTFSSKLLPYKLNMGKYFTGSLWIKSIKNLKIEQNKISFSLKIYGKDIIYTPKIGNQKSKIELGNINLSNDWESVFRFEKDKKILYIKPHLKDQTPTKKEGKKEIIINTLLKVFSDFEYPINLQETNPITAEFLGNVLNINLDVSNIYAVNNKLMIELRPIPDKDDKKKPPADKT